MVNQVVYIELVKVEFEIGDGCVVSLAMRSMSWPSTAGSLWVSNLSAHNRNSTCQKSARNISRDRDKHERQYSSPREE